MTDHRMEVGGVTEFQVKRRLAPGKKVIYILLGLLSAAILVLLGIYIAGVNRYKDKFFEHTSINGFDVSMMTVEEVEENIASLIDSYELKIIERNDVTEVLKGSDFGYGYVSKGEVQDFMNAQNTFAWPFYAGKEKEHVFETSASYDSQKLAELIDKLLCFDKKEVKKPKDAYLKYEDSQFVIVPETRGNWLINDAAKRFVIESIDFAKKEISFEDAGLYRKASVFRTDQGLIDTCNALNEYLKSDLSFAFGKKVEPVSNDIIKDWLLYGTEGKVSLDENAVYQYVNELAQEYDTYGTVRPFKTHHGTEVYVTGYEYGWEMDTEATTGKLIEAIKSGDKGTVEVEYIHTAKSHENADVGNNYVEVDMGTQHVWLYVDGEVVVSSDCVSGMAYDESRRTPEGIYTITYKESPSILRGENAEYESYVEYWMPFNGGIGLHDATWRYGVFGGDIYLYDGSHGCINLPLEVAGAIYDYIYEGYPVVCYY